MANLFQTEMTRMKVMSQPPLKEGTEGLLTPSKARKRSMLPKGSTLIKLHILICDVKKHKIVFQSLMMKTMKTTMMKKIDKENDFV